MNRLKPSLLQLKTYQVRDALPGADFLVFKFGRELGQAFAQESAHIRVAVALRVGYGECTAGAGDESDDVFPTTGGW